MAAAITSTAAAPGWRRHSVRLLLFLNLLLLPAACVPALFAFNAINPMAWVFATEVTVVNGLDAPVHVTPIGMARDRSLRGPLEMLVAPGLCLPALRHADFALAAGGTRSIP